MKLLTGVVQAADVPVVLAAAAGLALVVVVGVALPAVWSRHAYRRAAARSVLRLLMEALSHRRR